MNSIKILAPIFLTFLCVTSQVLAQNLSDNGGQDDETVATIPALVTEPAPLNPDPTGNPFDETKDETTTVEMEDSTTQSDTEAPTTTTPSNETTTPSSGNQPSLTFPVISVLALSYLCLH